MTAARPNVFDVLVQANLDDRLDQAAAGLIRSHLEADGVLLFDVDWYTDEVSLSGYACSEGTDYEEAATAVMPLLLQAMRRTEPTPLPAALLAEFGRGKQDSGTAGCGFLIPFTIGFVFESIVAVWSVREFVVNQVIPVLASVLPARVALAADRELEIQTGLSLRLTQSLVPEEVANEIIHSVMGHCGAGGGALWWQIPNREKGYTPVLCVGAFPGTLGRMTLPAQSPVTDYLASARPQIIRIAEMVSALPDADAKLFRPVERGLLIGLWLKDELSGFLVVAPHLAGIEYSTREIHYLSRLVPLAVVGLGNAWTYMREKQVSGLRTLLDFTRELSAGLDSARVFSAMVNLPAALIEFDRCALFVEGGTESRLAAVSGLERLPRKLSPDLQRLQDLSSWIPMLQQPCAYDRNNLELNTGSPRSLVEYCVRENIGSAYALPLADDEGTVGYLWWESTAPGHFSRSRSEWCRLVANQSTTALRNVLLFRQIPMKSFLVTLGETRDKWSRRMRGRVRYALAAVAVLVVGLLFVKTPITVRGSCHVQPAKPIGAYAQTPGWVEEVFVREGDLVSGGQPLAHLSNPELLRQIEDLNGELAIAERRRARSAHAGLASETRESALEWSRLRTQADYLVRKRDALVLTAPAHGRILTPNLENMVGAWMRPGDVLCDIAARDSMHVLVYPSLADLPYLTQGATVDCMFDLGEPVVIRGHLEQILPLSADLPTGVHAVVRAVPATPHRSLHIGLAGEAKIKGKSQALGLILFRRPWYWCKKIYWRYFGGLS